MRRRVVLGLALGMALGLAAHLADAKITLRPRSPHDNFFFHGNYSTQPFHPGSSFGVEIWNCADGTMPALLTGIEPLIICGYDAVTGPVLADPVYAVALPAGACLDHGRSCYYRDGSAVQLGGIRYLRVQYARRGHGNRVWLESFGDLSAADQANMLVLVTVDGVPRATLQETFTALPSGGWFSPF